MRIAFTVDSVLRCGGVRVPFEYCRALRALGHDAAIYAKGATDPSVYEWIERYNVPVRQLKELAFGVDVLISVWWPMLDELLEYPAKKRFHLVQGQDILSYPDGHEWAEKNKAAMQRDDYQYIAVSRWAGKSCKSPVVINNGIDTDFWFPTPKAIKPDFRVLVEASTQDDYKGGKTAVAVITALKERYRTVTCTGIGGEKHPVLDSHIAKANDEQMRQAYWDADVLLKTTWFDGFGMPHLEAMACGTPVVSTIAGGNLDFCNHQQNCLLAPVDDVAALTDAVSILLEKSDVRKKLTEGGLTTARTLTWQESARRLLEVL